MSEAWIAEETAMAKFEDKRLNERFAAILEAFGARPNASIPAALNGHTELTAAYHFFENAKVTPARILQPHYDATHKRCVLQKVVLCAQDTTELDFTRPKQQVVGAGPLNSPSRRGAYLHLIEAFTEDGTPLGAIGSKMWAREDADETQPKPTAKEKRKQRLALPMEEKESIRWLEGVRTTQKLAKQCPDTMCVSLGDSESDIYELFAEERTTENFHFIIRACHDRVVADESGVSSGIIRDALMVNEVLFTNEIHVRAREQLITCEKSPRRTTRVTRMAEVEVRAGTITIKAPDKNHHAVRFVTLNAVLVSEPNPPQGENPIEWILLTTLPIASVDDVRCVIQYYTVRWMIEIFFRTLKSGCRIEERHFETIERMLACTAVYIIVGWRTLYVCRMGRSCPDVDCDLIFDPSEWKSVWCVTHPREPLPPQTPKLGEMVRLVASLGGYVIRPNRKDPPGVETIWKGLQRTQNFAFAWNLFGPGATK